MAGKDAKATSEKPQLQGRARGTQDDLEILKMIIQENRGLYLKVLEKLRIQRALSKESIFSDAAKKHDQKRQTRKKAALD